MNPLGGKDGLFQFSSGTNHSGYFRRSSLRAVDLRAHPIPQSFFFPRYPGWLPCLSPLPGFKASSPLFWDRFPYYRRRSEGPSKTVPRRVLSVRQLNGLGNFITSTTFFFFFSLGFLSLVFLVSIVMDGIAGNPLGETIRNLWSALWPIP